MPLVDNAWYVDGSTGVTVNDLGSNSNTSGATLTLTSVTVPSGALIVLIASEVTSASSGTCADGTNGAYTNGSNGAMSGAAGFGTVFYFANSAALSAATITYTKQTSGRICSLSAFYVTGIATSTPLDATVTATTAVNSASPTVTAASAPAVTGELIVGACAYSNAAAKTLSNTGSFVTPSTNVSTQATASCGGGHLNVGGTLAPTFNPTLSGASDNITFILGFKPSGSLAGWWNVTPWAASTTYVTGNLVRQNATPNLNAERAFICVASTGGTGQSAATEPAWTTTGATTRGVKFTDNTVTWQEVTGVTGPNGDVTNTPNWTTVKVSTPAVLGQVLKGTASGIASYMMCTTAGTMGAAEPTWPAFTNAGATVTETAAVAVWTNIGAQSNFTGWQAPHARLANAFNWAQAGNTLYVATEHAEVQTSALTLTTPGTIASPCTIDCVSKSPVPPVATSTGATISTTGAFNIRFANVSNYAYWKGLTFQAGSSSSIATITLLLNAAGSSQFYKSCGFTLNNIGASSQFNYLGGDGAELLYDSCTFTFGSNTGHNFDLRNVVGVTFRNTTFAVGANVPTTVFTRISSLVLFDACDFSAFGAGKTLIGANVASGAAILENCKLGASVTVAAAPAATQQTTTIIRADSAATNYRHEKYHYAGTQTVETTIIRTGGASDGTTPLSWKIVSTANSKWILPFECIPITVWCDTTGSHTVTVYGTTTGGGVPNNDDIWITAEYLKDSGDPLGGFVTTTKSDNLAASTTTNNSSDASTWGGGGAGNGFKMVTPSFTVNQKGPITVYVYVAKASTTYYVDPRPSISGITVNRSLILAPGVYANELGGGSGSVSYIS